MNKTQAGRLLTLAHYLKTQVKRRHFNMNVPIVHTEDSMRGVQQEIEALMCEEPQSCGCVIAYYYGANDLPYGSVFTNMAGTGVPDKYAEMMFGYSNRTPKEQAEVIEDVVRKCGWTYA